MITRDGLDAGRLDYGTRFSSLPIQVATRERGAYQYFEAHETGFFGVQ